MTTTAWRITRIVDSANKFERSKLLVWVDWILFTFHCTIWKYISDQITSLPLSKKEKDISSFEVIIFKVPNVPSKSLELTKSDPEKRASESLNIKRGERKEIWKGKEERRNKEKGGKEMLLEEANIRMIRFHVKVDAFYHKVYLGVGQYFVNNFRGEGRGESRGSFVQRGHGRKHRSFRNKGVQ